MLGWQLHQYCTIWLETQICDLHYRNAYSQAMNAIEWFVQNFRALFIMPSTNDTMELLMHRALQQEGKKQKAKKIKENHLQIQNPENKRKAKNNMNSNW